MLDRVLVIGSINADHWYEVQEYAQPSSTVQAYSHKRCMGGKGVNQARALQLAGMDNVRFLGIVGDDDDGRWMTQELKRNNFPTEEILVDEAYRTGHVILQKGGKEDPAVLFYLGANNAFTPSVIERAIKDADVVVVQNEMNGIEDTLRQCRGKRVLFNPSPIVPDYIPTELFSVEWLVLNEQELLKLLSILNISTMSKVCNADLLKRVKSITHARNVIVTMSGKGSMAISEDDEIINVQAVKGNRVVDTVGAGDCYAGFMMRHLLNGHGLEESMKFAATAASLKIEGHGAFESIPTLSQVLDRQLHPS